MTITADDRRLPGISFEVAPIDADGALPRMDITAFVGFATAGPFDTPVRIEDPLRFRRIFGPDVTLTDETSATAARRSTLGPSVDAFFANGGRVCWVVRVGDIERAVTSRFLVPGVVGISGTDPVPAHVEARSPGSAFDDVRASATVQRRPLIAAGAPDLSQPAGSIDVANGTAVHPGQLIEISWSDGTHLWAPVAETTTGNLGRRRVRWTEGHWWGRSSPGDRPGATHRIHGVDLATGVPTSQPLGATAHEVDAGRSTLTTSTMLDDSWVGAVVTRPTAGATVELFVVEDVDRDAATATTTLRSSITWQQLDVAAPTAAATVDAISVVTLGLAAFQRDALTDRLDNLDLVSGAPRWWGELPSDARCFGGRARRAAADAEHPVAGPLDAEATAPRFALAAPDDLTDHAVVLPFGLRDEVVTATRSPRVEQAASPAERNGVGTYSPASFVDPALSPLGARTLGPAARRRYFVDDVALRGLHAVFPLGDVAVVAVPDACQLGWHVETTAPPSPLPVPLLAADDTIDRLTWTFDSGVTFPVEIEQAADPTFGGETTRTMAGDGDTLDPELVGCDARWFRSRGVDGAIRSGWSNSVVLHRDRSAFAPCEIRERLEVVVEFDGTTATWALHGVGPGPEPTPPDTAFDVEIADDSAFVNADRRTVLGPTTPPSTTEFDVGPPLKVHRWLRVRVRPNGATPTAWSRAVVLPAATTDTRVSDAAGGVVPGTVEIHRALAAMTAARRDMTAMLSFPRHYGDDDIGEHLARVRAGGALDGARHWVDHLHAHHPWIEAATADGSALAPPDGAVSGALAAGALQRGVWISTAGAPLARTIDVSQTLDDPHVLELRAERVNTVVRRRTGFVVIGNDTLSTDPTQAPVTVRRLLIVLRRLLVRTGPPLVFENHDQLLRSIVRTRLESTLGEMFRRGAFAGRTPAEAFRVICDDSNNPPTEVDAGRLVVEVLVAPSRPLEFLRIRFVQTDASGPDLLDVA